MMMPKCYSVSRSSIDENNESVSRSCIVFCHGIVEKLASVAEDLANKNCPPGWDWNLQNSNDGQYAN